MTIPSPGDVRLTSDTDGPHRIRGVLPLVEPCIVVKAVDASIDVRDGRRDGSHGS